MKGTQLLVRSKLYLSKRSPTILTCIGAAGVVATAVMAVRATPRAMKLCEDLRLSRVNDYEEEPTKLEYVSETWQCYIPAIMTGTATIACIFGANILNRRQQATLASAYMFLDRTYKDYKAKLIELYGEEADRDIRTAIAKDRYDTTDISTASGDKVMFYEEHYGKFFERTMLEVQDAEYQINRKLAVEGEASVNDFLELLGLSKVEIGDALGWSHEMICDTFYGGHSWIDFEHELVKMDDGMECYVINMVVAPALDYDIPF